MVCKRYAGSKQEAEDFLQEAFIRIYDKLHTYQHSGSLEGWVRRVVVHTALNKLKSRKYYDDIHEEMPVVDHTHLDVMSGFGEKDLLNMIAALPTGYRTVFNMYAIDGYDHAEIAEALGISKKDLQIATCQGKGDAKNCTRKTKKTIDRAYQTR